MFKECLNLKYAPQLLSTNIGSHCYETMFMGCENLQVTQKELPATTMTEQCYAFMYSDCLRLSVAPRINANILASKCFSYMFSGCYELVIAPEINAPTLVSSCCEYMFSETPKLKKITIRSVNGINTTNLEKWLIDGNSSGQIIIDASTTNDWEYNSNSGIPTGWVAIPV